MMLNVSRTPVPESWLSTLSAKPALGYNTLDKEALEVTVGDIIYHYFTVFMYPVIAGKEPL